MTTRLALAALLAAAACAHQAPDDGRVRDAAAPPRSAFALLPADEAARVKDPHDHGGKPLCQRCHLPDLRLAKAPNDLCRECHGFAHGNHPVDVVQKTPAPGLPLLPGGKVACHTCHDPHQGRSVLRAGFNDLCRTCHEGH